MQKYTTYDDLHATGPDGAYCGLLADERDVYLASEVDAEHSELIAHNVEAHARIAELETALREAIEGIGSWSCYATEYFREKHDLDGELKRLNSVLMERESQ